MIMVMHMYTLTLFVLSALTLEQLIMNIFIYLLHIINIITILIFSKNSSAI